jgi:hypothetical protein
MLMFIDPHHHLVQCFPYMHLPLLDHQRHCKKKEKKKDRFLPSSRHIFYNDLVLADTLTLLVVLSYLVTRSNHFKGYFPNFLPGHAPGPP